MALRARFRLIEAEVDALSVYRALFANTEYSVWLDSSRVEPNLSRYSFLGDASGPLGEMLTYRAGSGTVRVLDSKGSASILPGSIFDVLSSRLSALGLDPDPCLPLPFCGGYVGHLGYELKADCGATNRHGYPQPDATWLLVTRFVAIDHVERRAWLVVIGDDRHATSDEGWLDDIEARLVAIEQPVPADEMTAHDLDPETWLLRDRTWYLADVAACQRRLYAGDSYEICLTNTADLPFGGDPLDFYAWQRIRNPAPYAAYLKLGDRHVMCSSPERFLNVDSEGWIESRPIKGTARRSADPTVDVALREALASTPKTRAENLMIVDLMRSDLGRVCEAGSISVPGLMVVESYATVHQLVSTIRGRLREGVSPVHAAQACFPPGSMTGAPKLSTMRIIDGLETAPRGVYSGAIGYFSLTGPADLNVAIRTAVAENGRLTVGAGGAIVLDSDPEEEYEEMLLKARAALGLNGVAAAGRVLGPAQNTRAR